MLTKKQIDQFLEKGFLLINNLLTPEEIQVLVDELPVLFAQDSPEVFRQKENGAIRSVFSPEHFSETYNQIYRLDRLLNPVKQLLDDEVYLFQSKLNTKIALSPGVWKWHQDFTYWKEDGMLAPKAITVVIYLSDVTEFSGAMVVIPGSHRIGEIPFVVRPNRLVHDEDFKYVIDKEALRTAAQKCDPMVYTKGKKGTVLFFHANLLHSSAQNLYYENRDLLMFTYNSMSNKTNKVNNPRKSYEVKRDFTPVQGIHEMLK